MAKFTPGCESILAVAAPVIPEAFANVYEDGNGEHWLGNDLPTREDCNFSAAAAHGLSLCRRIGIWHIKPKPKAK